MKPESSGKKMRSNATKCNQMSLEDSFRRLPYSSISLSSPSQPRLLSSPPLQPLLPNPICLQPPPPVIPINPSDESLPLCLNPQRICILQHYFHETCRMVASLMLPSLLLSIMRVPRKLQFLRKKRRWKNLARSVDTW